MMNRIVSEREKLAPQLAAAAETAFSRSRLIQKTFRINGHHFRMRFAGEELAKQMTRALEPLAVDSTDSAALTIDCWDEASTGVACPRPDWPSSLFSGRGEIRGLDAPEMRIAYFDWLKLWNVYFPASGRAYYCLAQAEPFSIQQFGSPALTLFSWWFGTLGWQFTHAAAVGTEKGGVLVVGHGGAGKSTLAFSTLGPSTPLRYLSDDYCVLAPGNPTRALALYHSGKLTETSLELLPHLRSRAANADDFQREKAIFFLQEEFPGEPLLSVPLRAIVLSELNNGETSLTPIVPHEILRIVGDSTLRQLAGSDKADFLRLMKLVRGVPTYRLRHGSNAPATHQLLLRLCES